jgi:hypothetical protein
VSDPKVLERISRWEAAGLLDASTAERLRADEAAALEPTGQAAAGGATGAPRLGTSGTPTWIVEFFVFLGGALVLGAWHWQISQFGGPDADRLRALFVGSAIPAIAFSVAAFVLHSMPGARGRAAGLLLLVAGVEAAGSAAFALAIILPDQQTGSLALASLVWLGFALLARRAVASWSTTVGLLGAIVAFGWFVGEWLRELAWGRPDLQYGSLSAAGPGPIQPLAEAVWWLIVAAGAYLVVRWEVRSGVDSAAGRRVSLARIGTGLIAVVGVARAALAGDRWTVGHLEPIVGDLLIVAVAGGLVWLAARDRSGAWLGPAALGIFIAITDVNATYLASGLGTGVALLIEGLALIGIGAVTELLRRRLAVARAAGGG